MQIAVAARGTGCRSGWYCICGSKETEMMSNIKENSGLVKNCGMDIAVSRSNMNVAVVFETATMFEEFMNILLEVIIEIIETKVNRFLGDKDYNPLIIAARNKVIAAWEKDGRRG